MPLRCLAPSDALWTKHAALHIQVLARPLVRQLTQHYVLTLLRSCMEASGGSKGGGAKAGALSALQQMLALLTMVSEKKVVLGANFYQLYVITLLEGGGSGSSDGSGIAARGSSGVELR